MSTEIAPTSPAFETGKPWWRGEVWSALLLGALSMVAGVLVAVIWRAIAPTVQGVVSISNGEKSAYYANAETKGFVGQDGTFGICAAVAGILLAIVAFTWFRRRGPVGAALALAGAGIGAAYFAAWFGTWLGPGRGSIVKAAENIPNNGTFDLPLQLSATGVIWLWPAVAVGLYFLLMLIFGPADPEPQQPESFPGWADPVDLTAPGPEDPAAR
ncbi:DUF2567 domain-containing protein [Actinospica sp. MGRD01-02]|uniref:DUF2567 domain-containing protein n=1 Tax=Actinospica acidithermotolerans TaxID=2828514 RepID=A0A941IMH9_9ACTN|nr:DUF2567 domain-containing protein [Actinospica acidithermotolerans]MBR7828581.1 DUF2567 domain-containing protein [Actinospica acidithermotolerans]